MFALGAFVVAGIVQELWRGVRARRAIAREPVAGRARVAGAPQPAPLRRLPRAHRHRRAVHRRRRLVGLPGRPRRAPEAGRVRAVGGYDVHLRQADRASCTRRRTGGWSGSRSAPQLRVAKDGKLVETLRPEGLLPVEGAGSGPVGRFFEGNATTEVALKAGLRRTSWIAGAGHRDAAADHRAGRQGSSPTPPTG